MNGWILPSEKKPEARKRVLVHVQLKGFKYKLTTVAEWIPKHEILAEDFLDPDCDSDFCDEGPDGREYAPEGWYECPAEAEVGYKLSGEVLYWKVIEPPVFDLK